MLIEQLAALSRAMPGGDALPRQIANAHAAFNIPGVGAFRATVDEHQFAEHRR